MTLVLLSFFSKSSYLRETKRKENAAEYMSEKRVFKILCSTEQKADFVNTMIALESLIAVKRRYTPHVSPAP